MKKSMVFFVFLLMSSFFIMGSYSVPILAPPNMTKDFALSTEYIASNQSITSFSETLPDDVLYYPDALLTNDTPVLASNGTGDFGDSYGDYRDSWVLDGNCFGDHSDPYYMTLEFISPYPNYQVEFFYMNILFEIGTNTTSYLYNHVTAVWDDIGVTDTWLADFWLNETFGDQYVADNYSIYFASDGQTSSEAWYVEIDYAYCQFSSITNTFTTKEITATSGDDDYTNSKVLDSVAWRVLNSEQASFEFVNNPVIVAEFTYHCYAKDDFAYGDSLLKYYNGTDWLLLETFALSNAWYNDTVYMTETYETNSILFKIDSNVGETLVDFLSVSVTYGSGAYAESFADVSDWTPTQGTITTDNDVANITKTSGSYAYATYDLGAQMDYSGYYIEVNVVEGIERWSVQLRNASALPTVTIYTTDWRTGTGTFKFPINSALDVGAIWIFVDDTQAAGYEWVTFDYLRIGPNNELGWEHDFSTTEGISSADGGTIATDGDKVTLTADGDGSTFIIVADTTATATAISTDYYPFFGIKVDSWSGSWTLEQYNGSAYATLLNSIEISTAITRRNMASLDSYIYWWRFTLPNNAVFILDWIKAYSIANFTVFEVDNENVDDVLYVIDDILYCSSVTTDIIGLGNDLTLSITSPFDIFAATMSTGADNFRFRELADTNQYHDQGVIFETLYSTTLTDYTFMFYGSASITFISFLQQLPEWNEIGEAELIVVVFFDYWALNMSLIFGGLITMLLSACIMAVKMRDRNITKDAGMLLLFLFCIGWGLFIGGNIIG